MTTTLSTLRKHAHTTRSADASDGRSTAVRTAHDDQGEHNARTTTQHDRDATFETPEFLREGEEKVTRAQQPQERKEKRSKVVREEKSLCTLFCVH